MAPKSMTKTAAGASPAKAAPSSPGGRNLRSSGRTLRSNSSNASLVSLDDIQKKSPAKKKLKKEKKKAEPKDKGKKAAEGESASGTTGSGAGADPKGKGKQVAAPEGGDSAVIVVERTQCKSFLRRATEGKDGATDVVVKLNSEKPRSGPVLLPNVWNPDSFMNRTRPYLTRGVKRLRVPLGPLPSISIPYRCITIMDDGDVSIRSLAVIPFPIDANHMINDPLAAGMPIGDTCVTSSIRGLSFLLGDHFHRVCNLGTGLISNFTEQPVIFDPEFIRVKYCLGYDSDNNQFKIARFLDFEEIWGEGTQIHVYTIGVDENWRHVHTLTPTSIVFNPLIQNDGVEIMDMGSSKVSFLCTALENNFLVELVLTFNFRDDQVTQSVTPNFGHGEPILCNLHNRLCCAYNYGTNLRIYVYMGDNHWQLGVNINTIPDFGILDTFLPICLYGTRLLVAHRYFVDHPADIPPGFPVNDPEFFQFPHALLIDVEARTTEIVDSVRYIRWFQTKVFEETNEPLPY